MCGLCGVAGLITAKEDQAFSDLMVISSLRGEDSAGVLFVGNGVCTVVKKVGNPFELFDSITYEKEFRYTNNVLLGHTRAASKGGVNLRNAHPFDFEKLVGAHNGTLTTQHLLDDHKDFAVDSENIYYHMDKHGVSDTVSKCGGAYALTWFDKIDKTLNFVRNEERTLFTVLSKDNRTLFWASEAWMLAGALGRNGVKHGEIKDVVPHTHYKVKINTETMFPSKCGELPAFTETQVPKFEYPKPKAKENKALPNPKGGVSGVVVNIKKGLSTDYTDVCGKFIDFIVTGESVSMNGSCYITAVYEDNQNVALRIFTKRGTATHERLSVIDKLFTGKVVSVTASEGSFGIIDGNTVLGITDTDWYTGTDDDCDQDLYLEGYEGRMLSLPEWKKATNRGCAWCSDVPMVSEHSNLLWVSGNDFVCASCALIGSVREFTGI